MGDQPRNAGGGDGAVPGPGGRILGIDVARALAIVGMLAVHVGPTRASELTGRLYALPHGRASILFVLVAGIGVSMLASSRRRSLARARIELAWRSLALLVAGLVLQELEHRVFVILQTYGALFLVAVPLVRARAGTLVTLAVLATLLGPVAYLSGVLSDPDTFDRSPVRFGDGVGGVLHGLILSGPYPLIVWIAPFLAGMAIGRADLRAPRTRARLLLGGGAAVLLVWAVVPMLAEAVAPGRLVGWSRLLDPSPHSQMPPWLLSAIGSAAATVGACLFLAHAAPRPAWPVAATGQLALTVYVAHLVLLHGWSDLVRSDAVAPAARRVLLITLVAAAGSTAWRAAFRRGPLEALLRLPGGRVEPREGGPAD